MNGLHQRERTIRPLLRMLLAVAIFMGLWLPIGSLSCVGDEGEFAPEPHEIISDLDARLALARVLSYRFHTLGEAREAYERILSEHPDHLEAGLELSDVLVRLGDVSAARKRLQRLLADRPNHTGLLGRLAEVEAAVGHAQESRSLFEQALRLEPDDIPLQMAYAQAMNRWGDFYRIERIYRHLLQKSPDDVHLLEKLAEVLVSAQRYEEAEGIYERLKRHGWDKRRFCLEMAKLYDRKKDFAKALEAIACVRQPIDGPTSAPLAPCTAIEPDPADAWTAPALEIESRALNGLGNRKEAEACIATLLNHPQTEMAGWLAAAKTYRKLAASDETLWETSQDAAGRAMRLAVRQYPDLADVLRPENLKPEKYLPPLRNLPKTLVSILYLQFGKQVLEEAWIDRLLSDPEVQALDLYTWAECYTEDRRPDIAWRLCARAVEIDPACFPARLALAENLAFDRRFSDSLKVLEALAQEDPENVKVWITYARVLSWDKQYDAAIDRYDRIHAYNPMDPVPVRESARVAVWAKRMDEAMRRYRSLMEPSVDERLLQALKQSPSMPLLQVPAADRREPNTTDTPSKGYNRYETLIEQMDRNPEFSADETLQRIRIDLLPEYRIQKWAYLESEAKWKAWNLHFLEAKDAYEALTAFDPGNAEALFDDAQVKCSLGLCDEERTPYEALLLMDPTHVQAKRGLERNDIRSRPKIGINPLIWSEKGRGDLSNIVVHRIQVLAEMPIRQDRYAVSAGMDSFFERPGSADRTFEALGYTLHARGVLSPSLSGNLKWTHKVYQEADLGASDFFDALIRWKIRDWLHVDFGFERADAIANAFALQQQSRADRWKIGIHSQMTRRLEAGLKAEAVDYADDNSGIRIAGSIGYAFTDHPKIFKVTLSETYRDTQQANRFFYQGDRLVDIVYPYWTPQALTESTITLEWVHDLAKELFCGAPENVYDLRLSFGTDTEDNAMVRLEGDWKLEIADHWLLVLRGLIHESRQWDASGVWAEIRYRF